MDIKTLTALIRDVGFPIALVVYLLVRFDRMMALLVQQTSKELEVLYQLRDFIIMNRTPQPLDLKTRQQ